MSSFKSMCDQLAAIKSRYANVPTSYSRLQIAVDFRYDDVPVKDELEVCAGSQGGRQCVRTQTSQELTFAGTTGTAIEPTMQVLDTFPLSVKRIPGRQFALHYYGFGDDYTGGNEACTAFCRLAATTWQSLARATQVALTVPEYANPSQGRTPEDSWILALHAIAWQETPPSALRADRCLRLSGRHTCNIESIIRQPTVATVIDGLPRSTSQGDAIHSMKETIKAFVPEDAVSDLRIPPPRFFAIMQPDVFLASELAIQYILDRWGTNNRAGRSKPDSSGGTKKVSDGRNDHAVSVGWTAGHLCKVGGIKSFTLHRICKAAKVKCGQPGDTSFLFDVAAVEKLVEVARRRSDGKRKWKSASDAWQAKLLEPYTIENETLARGSSAGV